MAAHLANGLPVAALGSPVNDPLALPDPKPQRLSGGRLCAEVVYVDRFGNLVTNVGPLTAWGETTVVDLRVIVSGESLAVRRT